MTGSSIPPAVIVVSGTHSGAGKTTVTCGLMAACTLRGLVVQPFKCGPDFLDGMQHEAAIAVGSQPHSKIRKSINLDGWMMKPESIRDTVKRHAIGANVCIVEGVAGLYDGRNGLSDDGSTSEIAKILDASVVLVINAEAMARSVAAMALGYIHFDCQVHVDAVLANKVGGPSHVEWIRQAVDQLDKCQETSCLFVGGLPRNQAICIPERHLGLTMPHEHASKDRFLALAKLMEEHINVDALLECARRRCGWLTYESKVAISRNVVASPKCRIGVAMDEAFCFYYHDNLYLLRQQGAELVPFSPIKDTQLPSDLDGLYLGGGYPELHATKLQDNLGIRQEIYSLAIDRGAPVLAECGGFMYLCGHLNLQDGSRFEMCGVFADLEIQMSTRMNMYYAIIESSDKNPIFEPGTTYRGQRFHFSHVHKTSLLYDQPLIVTPQVPGSEPIPEGYAIGNTLASYFHLHMASNPGLSAQFVSKCVKGKR